MRIFALALALLMPFGFIDLTNTDYSGATEAYIDMGYWGNENKI